MVQTHTKMEQRPRCSEMVLRDWNGASKTVLGNGAETAKWSSDPDVTEWNNGADTAE